MLADELIAAYRNHESIAHVYHLLVPSLGVEGARREFVRFLRGERSEQILQVARDAIASEPAKRTEDHCTREAIPPEGRLSTSPAQAAQKAHSSPVVVRTSLIASGVGSTGGR